MAVKRRGADAVWKGGGRDGQGAVTTESGGLSNVAVSAGKRFGEEKGANPEELIGAALVSCFTMALAFGLNRAGHSPEELRAHAETSIEQQNGGWSITAIALDLEGRVPGVSEEEFVRLAEEAKTGCPVSRSLKPEITLRARLL
jgi:lipoyl-dependent peroxiredoxin